MKTSTTVDVDCNNCSVVHKIHYAEQYRYRRVFNCHCEHRIVVSRYDGGDIIISGGKRKEEKEDHE